MSKSAAKKDLIGKALGFIAPKFNSTPERNKKIMPSASQEREFRKILGYEEDEGEEKKEYKKPVKFETSDDKEKNDDTGEEIKKTIKKIIEKSLPEDRKNGIPVVFDPSKYKDITEQMDNDPNVITIGMDGKEKKSAFNFTETVRARNKEALSSMKSEFSQGTFFNNNAVLIPKIGDPFFKEKLHHLKKKYLEEVSNKVSGAGGEDYYKDLVDRLRRAGANSLETRKELESVLKKEHSYAMNHAFNFINENMDNTLARYMRSSRTQELSDKAKEYKDSIENNNGRFQLGADKKMSVKSIAETSAGSNILDRMNNATEYDHENKENQKVDNLAKLLKADRQKYIIK